MIKLTQKQPICLSRNRKGNHFLRIKPQISAQHNATVLSQIGIGNSTKSISTSTISEVPQMGWQNVRPATSRQQACDGTGTTEPLIKIQSLSINIVNELQEEIRKKDYNIQERQSIIESLAQYNARLEEEKTLLLARLKMQEEEKKSITLRVYAMEQDIECIRNQYEQEQQENQREQEREKQKGDDRIYKPVHGLERKNASVDLNSYQPNGSMQSAVVYRRASLSDSFFSQDWMMKAKEFKNELQLEKIRKNNVELELKSLVQNTKVQTKRQLQSIQNKMQSLQNQLVIKNEQVKQKERIINKYILKK